MKRTSAVLIRRISLALVFLGATVLIWKVIEAITPPMIYMVHAEFLELPPTDEDLKDWLLQQPGVYQGLIVREGNSLTLNWFHITKRFADPISPTVRDEFERFGYKGLVNYSENKGRVDK